MESRQQHRWIDGSTGSGGHGPSTTSKSNHRQASYNGHGEQRYFGGYNYHTVPWNRHNRRDREESTVLYRHPQNGGPKSTRRGENRDAIPIPENKNIGNYGHPRSATCPGGNPSWWSQGTSGSSSPNYSSPTVERSRNHSGGNPRPHPRHHTNNNNNRPTASSTSVSGIPWIRHRPNNHWNHRHSAHSFPFLNDDMRQFREGGKGGDESQDLQNNDMDQRVIRMILPKKQSKKFPLSTSRTTNNSPYTHFNCWSTSWRAPNSEEQVCGVFRQSGSPGKASNFYPRNGNDSMETTTASTPLWKKSNNNKFHSSFLPIFSCPTQVEVSESLIIGNNNKKMSSNYCRPRVYQNNNIVFLPPPPTMKPQGVRHNWDLRELSVEYIGRRCAELMAQTKALFDIVANADSQNLCYDTVLKPLLEAHRYGFLMGTILTFPRHVHGNRAIREASSEATKKLDESNVEMGMRGDVYEKLVEYQGKGKDLDALKPEYKRCLERFLSIGRRNGLHLDSGDQAEIKRIKKRISELTLQFSRNLNEENTTLYFAGEELEGLSEGFLNSLDVNDFNGKYKVTLKYQHFFPITRKCVIPQTRKLIETAFQGKCQHENTPILEEIIELRQLEAKLLGYPNHATLSQDVLMAKSPQVVKEFLDNLISKLQPLWKAEKKLMTDIKQMECERYGFPWNGQLDYWDFRYYMRIVEEDYYEIDQELIMDYFPIEQVTWGMLSIYEDIFSLTFIFMPTAEKWHEDVLVYQVRDRQTAELLGYFYLDLFSREGKFGHSCCVPLQPGCLDAKGVKQPAISAMLTNFNYPTDMKPCLLDHREVEMYFHEFGHLMHTICSKAETAVFFGTRVETDFVETPSQMLENWVWEKETLRRLSCHYLTRTRMPDEMIERLWNSRNACAGGLNLRQVVLAKFDQEVHLREEKINTRELYAQILKEIMDFEAIPGTNMPANFTHLCVGYSGRYYSYLWSDVFSQDMFRTVFKPNGILNPIIGKKYRECILEPGGSIDAREMLRNFLGREPNINAYLECKGLRQEEDQQNPEDWISGHLRLFQI